MLPSYCYRTDLKHLIHGPINMASR